jgi:hypothetical protein
MEGVAAMSPRHLGAILAAALAASAPGTARADDTTPTKGIQSLNPLQSSTITDLKAFAERPLFSARRRPQTQGQTPDDVEPVKDEPIAAELTLLGVTSGPEGAMARIATSGKESRSVRQGEEIDGWNVQTIDGSSVVLAKGEETMTLTIFNRSGDNAAEVDAPANSDGGIVFGPADTDETTEPKSPVRMIQSK